MIDGNIKPEEYFHLRDGRVLTDLKELFYALKGMDDSVFSHHLTQDRNDFGNWILHVFKEREIANEIFDSKNKEEIVSALEKRLFPKLEQLEIEDKTKSGIKKFDFRQQMSEKFETVGDASQKQKEDTAKIQPAPANPENSVNEYNEFSISKSKDPDLTQIVQEIKKKRGRKPKSQAASAQVSSDAGMAQFSQQEQKVQPAANSSPDVPTLQKAAELVKAYPFEKTTAREMNEQSEQMQKMQSEILDKEKEAVGKIDEILLKERELELREQKILDIEERLEKELLEVATKKDPKFFSKEFVHGLLIGLLTALIVGLLYVKFWM